MTVTTSAGASAEDEKQGMTTKLPFQSAADRTLPASSDLCTISEAARRLGIKRVTAQSWVHRGKITDIARDAQGRRLYFLDHFRELMEKSTAARHTVYHTSGTNCQTV